MIDKKSTQLTFTLQVFREEKLYVAYNPELDVSSCGESVEEAKENLRDAVSGFLKSAHKHGTLDVILKEVRCILQKFKMQNMDPASPSASMLRRAGSVG